MYASTRINFINFWNIGGNKMKKWIVLERSVGHLRNRGDEWNEVFNDFESASLSLQQHVLGLITIETKLPEITQGLWYQFKRWEFMIVEQ